MKAKLSIIGLVMFAICTVFAQEQDGLHQAMKKSMEKMKAIKMTGDPDKDFAMIMDTHHQGGIDMANAVVASGKDGRIKTIAQRMIRNQQQERKKLQQHANKQDQKQMAQAGTGTSAPKSEFSTEMQSMLKEMNTKAKSMKMSGDIDRDFAQMMIDHHVDGIKIAQAEVRHGNMKELKNLAQRIRDNSQKDISELEDWLSSQNNNTNSNNNK